MPFAQVTDKIVVPFADFNDATNKTNKYIILKTVSKHGTVDGILIHQLENFVKNDKRFHLAIIVVGAPRIGVFTDSLTRHLNGDSPPVSKRIFNGHFGTPFWDNRFNSFVTSLALWIGTANPTRFEDREPFSEIAETEGELNVLFRWNDFTQP